MKQTFRNFVPRRSLLGYLLLLVLSCIVCVPINLAIQRGSELLFHEPAKTNRQILGQALILAAGLTFLDWLLWNLGRRYGDKGPKDA